MRGIDDKCRKTGVTDLNEKERDLPDEGRKVGRVRGKDERRRGSGSEGKKIHERGGERKREGQKKRKRVSKKERVMEKGGKSESTRGE